MVIDTSKLTSGSWKTTVTGILTAAAGFVTFSPALFTGPKWAWVNELAKYVMIGGLAGMGLASKDNNVTGGTKLTPDAIPDARLHAEAVAAKTETPAEASPVPVPPKE